MENLYLITLLGFFVGIVGTGLGGVLSLFIKNNKGVLSFLLGFTGGIMLSLIAFQILPKSYLIGGTWIEIIGVGLGVIFIILIENLLPHNINNPYIKSSIIIGISMAVHNIPEGLAIGSSFMSSKELGIYLSTAIFLHNIPGGIAISTPLNINKSSNKKIILSTILAGFPTGIGAFLGVCFGTISDSFIALCLAFAGGAMLYIVCDEFIPQGKTLHGGRVSTMGIIVGFLLGMMLP